MAIKFRGQMIYVKGDPVVRYLPDGSDGNTPDVDLLLTYTNSEDTVENALRTEQKFQARVLVVGGGGAGGYGTTCTIYLGGGGGGVQAGGRSGTNPGGGDEMEQLDRRRAYYYTPERRDNEMKLLRVIILVLWLIFHRPTR